MKPGIVQGIIIHVKTTFNNTILTLTDLKGRVLTWVSAGSCGFKGFRKGTAFAAKKTVDTFLKKSMDYISSCGLIKIYVSGFGSGRENALRGLSSIEKSNREKIVTIRETTKISHNGCRPPKKRRL